MHGKIALLQLFQKHYSFLSNDAFLTENFDDFSHLLLKNSYSKERKGVYVIFIYNTEILLPLIFDEQTDKKRYASTENRTHDQDWFT